MNLRNSVITYFMLFVLFFGLAVLISWLRGGFYISTCVAVGAVAIVAAVAVKFHDKRRVEENLRD